MKNKLRKIFFLFIFFISLSLGILLSMKNHLFIETYDEYINAPYLLAKSIIKEPKLLEKWFE